MAEPMTHYHHRISPFDNFKHTVGAPTDCRCEPECYPQRFDGGLVWVVVQHAIVDPWYPRSAAEFIVRPVRGWDRDR